MFFLAQKYNPLTVHEILRDGNGIWGNILGDIQDCTRYEMVWFTEKRICLLVRRLDSWYSCEPPAGESHLASVSLTILRILKGTKNVSLTYSQGVYKNWIICKVQHSGYLLVYHDCLLCWRKLEERGIGDDLVKLVHFLDEWSEAQRRHSKFVMVAQWCVFRIHKNDTNSCVGLCTFIIISMVSLWSWFIEHDENISSPTTPFIHSPFRSLFPSLKIA